jgi:transcriptional regulator with XRE-family HTH domain
MSNVTFQDYIRKRREEKELPLRKVVAYLDIDTTTLSKVKRGARPTSPDYLKPFAEILELDLKKFKLLSLPIKSIKTLEAWNI